MCGIIGVFKHPESVSLVQKGLSLLKARGRDGYGIATEEKITLAKTPEECTLPKEKCALGHALHAIIDHVPQPLQRKGTLVANCEIYNWKELSKKHNIPAQNDAQLLLGLLDKKGTETMPLLDGVFSFAYWHNKKIILARDTFGVKPLWYVHTDDIFAFCSEKKILEALGFIDVKELNPRHTLSYDIEMNALSTQYRNFITHLPENAAPLSQIKNDLVPLLNNAIAKRIPEQKFGLLFSGGIDSTYLAHHFKKKGLDFKCYTAAVEGQTPAEDLVYAKKVAKDLSLKLNVKTIKQENIPKYLKKIIPIIEDSNVVKAGVALTFFLACEEAKKDGCKVIFSGLGSEEIFAGYQRHKNAADINKECVHGLLRMYERDLYRDDVITMANSLELRVPFLDKELADYALRIPSSYKIINDITKKILRDIALEQGIPKEYSMRKKRAAQYGSRIDHALGKLAKKEKKTKSEYLRQFYPSRTVKLGVLFSGGKDSALAAYIMKKQNYALRCLITMKSINPDSYMFHTPAIEVTKLQAKAMGLPLIMVKTKGEKEEELEDLKKAIKRAKEKYGIEGIVTGALFSTYQKDRIEKICDKLGLKIFAPLWHKPQDQEMMELLDQDFKFIFSSIAAEGLDESWLGRPLTYEDLEKLKILNEKIGLNVAGEGGEYESLVLDCPLFEKQVEIIAVNDMESPTTGRINITEAHLS